MLDVDFVPITTWPEGDTANRTSSKIFQVDREGTLNDLETTLGHLKAENVIVETFIPKEMINNNGLPKASAKASHPGIRLKFHSRLKDKRTAGGEVGQQSFATDKYDSWEGNLRAIYLTLEALRGIERWGTARGNQQFSGWKQLPAPQTTADIGAAAAGAGASAAIPTGVYPAPAPSPSPAQSQAQAKPVTIEAAVEAATYIANISANSSDSQVQLRTKLIQSSDAVEETYNDLAKRFHPDKAGMGFTGAFKRINAEIQTLRNYHRQKKEKGASS